MSYTFKKIGTIKVSDDGDSHKFNIECRVDSLNMAGIVFGNSMTLRLNETDLNALRELLHDASVQLMRQNDSYYKYGTSEREIEEAADDCIENDEEPYFVMCPDCQDTYDINSIHMCNN